MITTLVQTFEICGISVDLKAEFRVQSYDGSLDVESCEGIQIDSDLKGWIEASMEESGRTNRNRKFKKQVRQWCRKIEREVSRFDDSQFDTELIAEESDKQFREV